MSRSMRHRRTKRRQSIDNDSLKIQTQTKNKKARTTGTSYIVSSNSGNSKSNMYTKKNSSLHLSVVYPEKSIESSQVVPMVLEPNNDADDDSYVDTETTEDTNGNGDNDDADADADDDFDSSDNNDETPETDADDDSYDAGGNDSNEDNNNDSNDDDNNDSNDEDNNNSNDDNKDDSNDGGNSGDDENESNNDDEEDVSAVEDEPAANILNPELYVEAIDLLHTRYNEMVDTIQTLNDRLNITERNIRFAFDRVTQLEDRINEINLRLVEANNEMALLVPRLDLARILAEINGFQDDIMRRINLLERTLNEALNTIELLYQRVEENDNNVDQPQENVNQQPPVADPQEEEAIPGVIPQGNPNGEPNDHAPNLHFEIQQLIYVENIGFIDTVNIQL